MREVVLLDKAVRPHLFHQLFLGQNVGGVFEQHEQGVEHFWRERHLPIVSKEKPLSGVNSETVE